jgi:UDP-glucose 4-epimerase
VRVLVTGAGGHVASRLLPRLAAEHDVVGLVRPGSAGPAAGVDALELDLAALDAARLPTSLDAVVHLAQSSAFRRFPEGASDVYAVNVHATAVLLEHARACGATVFVHASSGSVYGGSPDPIGEDAPLDPRTHYAATRAAADVLVRSYASVLPVVVLRPFAIYGPGQGGMLVANLLERIRAGRTVEIEGDPGIRLNPIHVDDAAHAFEAALRRNEPLTVNVAGDEVVTLRSLVDRLAAAAGRTAHVVHTGQGTGGALVGDNARMKQELGVAPRIGLDQGLAEVVSASSREP